MTRRSTLTALRPTRDPMIDEERVWAFLAVLPTTPMTHRERVFWCDTLWRLSKRRSKAWKPWRRENRELAAELRRTAETLKTA
jgi:hypothetical protein